MHGSVNLIEGWGTDCNFIKQLLLIVTAKYVELVNLLVSMTDKGNGFWAAT